MTIKATAASMTKLAIVGAGDLGLQLAHYARQTGFSISGFFDDTAIAQSAVGGSLVLGPLSEIESAFHSGVFEQILIGIGYKHLHFRQSLYTRLSATIPFATLIHPSSTIDPTCSIGSGAVIYPGCVLDMNTVIEDNVLLNLDCVVAHDSRVGAGSFLSPSVKVAGFVTIAPMTLLGIGTIVIDNLKIGSDVRTAAGAVVVNDITTPGLYMGIPAKLKTQPVTV